MPCLFQVRWPGAEQSETSQAGGSKMAAHARRKVSWHNVNKDDIPLSSVIDEYLQYHDALNHSPKTVRWYSDILSALNDFLGADARLRELAVQRVRAYQSPL